MNNANALRFSPGPHVRSRLTTGDVMYDVILALLPAAVFGVWRFGTRALLLILSSVCAAVLVGFAIACFVGKENTIRDGSAAVTGLLLAMTLPPDVPVAMAFVGGASAVILKALFGGLGRNRLNPALMGRCLLMVVLGSAMTAYGRKSGFESVPVGADIVRVFLGTRSALIGGAVIALLLGGAYLLWNGGISWHIPVGVIGGYTLLAMSFDGAAAGLMHTLLFLTGGGMLAAFFLATDPVTSPVSEQGQVGFGVSVGLLSVLFGRIMAVTEAVCLAVLLADLLTPLFDRLLLLRGKA